MNEDNLSILPRLQLRRRRCTTLRHRYRLDFNLPATASGQQHTTMFVSTLLIVWGWWFHLLSRLCFWAANAYISSVSRCILVPLGYQPLMALQQIGTAGTTIQPSQLNSPQRRTTAIITSDSGERITELYHGISDIQHRVKRLQQGRTSSPNQQENVQRWFAGTATCDADGLAGDNSCLSLVANMAERASQSRRMSCAAAAAAMALCGHAGVSADAAAAAVGAAAMLAQQLTSSTDSTDSTPQSCQRSQRNSSCCTVPPLTFEVSDELQRELDEAAPAEFLCPISRVLMTDPVCTPSGFTYQRTYIEAYIAKTGHDPARDSTLVPQQLYPNIVVRDQIATWLQKHGVET